MSSNKIIAAALKSYCSKFLLVPRQIRNIRNSLANRSVELALHVEQSLKDFSKYAVDKNLGPRLRIKDAERAMRWSRPTNRRHLELLAECGEIKIDGDVVTLQHLHARIPAGGVVALPSSPTYWADRRTAQAILRREQRCRRVGKEFSLSEDERAVISRTSETVYPLCFKGRRTPTKDSVAPSQRVRVEQPPASSCLVAPQFVGAHAPRKCPPPMSKEEIDAVERELLAGTKEKGSAIDAGLKLMGPIAAKLARISIEQPVVAPTPPPVAIPTEDTRKQPTPRKAPTRPAQCAPKEVVALAEQRGFAALNITAVVNTGAPITLIGQAMGITMDATGQHNRRHGRVKDSNAFLMGTIRRLMLWGKNEMAQCEKSEISEVGARLGSAAPGAG